MALSCCIDLTSSEQALVLEIARGAIHAGLHEEDKAVPDGHELTPVEPLAATSREDLLAQLQPGADGLLLQDGRYRSTFLPKVWEQLPEPYDFLAQLLAKAGLPADHWSPSLRVHRYQTLTFGDAPACSVRITDLRCDR